MIEKNQEYTGIVERFGGNGEGIIKNGDFVVMVPFCIPTEKVRYKILKVQKNYAFGKVVEVAVPADDRVRPVCPTFFRCGGCQLQHVKYSAQLKLKSSLVAGCFKKIAGLDVKVLPTVKSPSEYGYRNKLQLPVAEVNGETVVGFFAENSHRIVKIDSCAIHPVWAEKLIKDLNEYIRENNIKGYNEELKTGVLRHVVCREAENGFIVTLVVYKNKLKNLESLIAKLGDSLKNFSLFINVNDNDTNVIFGDEFILVHGKETLEGELSGIKYDVGVQSFLQVNSAVAAKLYQTAVKMIAPDEETVVIDAYSGAGLMTALFSKKCKKAYGIEIVKEAVETADKLKIKNNLADKMVNIHGDCAVELPPLVKKLTAAGDKVRVVLDPPRKGCDQKVLKAIKDSDIEKIVYISCNPATLARDVGLLTGSLKLNGNELVKDKNYVPDYTVDYVQPFDMFAQTKHVETLVCLSKKSEKHISIDVEFGESDGQISLKKLQKELNEQKLKKKTTYKDIQKWVEENYGFKVHTAYIAEVKRDLGLPMYDAPNAVEELKRPRSHPTAEMSDAIKAALKHFEII